MAVRGVQKAVAELNRQIAAIEGRSREGLQEAALFVRGEAVPMTPVDTGTLRNSSFTDVTAPGATPIVARVGYTAEYAPYVHEMRRTFDIGPRQPRRRLRAAQRRRNTFRRPRIVRSRSAKRHRPWAPGTGPKFLQRAVMENTAEILQIIKARAEL